jgi:hypothetical protein
MMTIFCGLPEELPSPAVPTVETKSEIRLSNGVAAAASSLASPGAGNLFETDVKFDVGGDIFVNELSNDQSPTLT